MSIFNGKDGFAKDKDKYIKENRLESLDDEIIESIKDIAVAEKINGCLSYFYK